MSIYDTREHVVEGFKVIEHSRYRFSVPELKNYYLHSMEDVKNFIKFQLAKQSQGV